MIKLKYFIFVLGLQSNFLFCFINSDYIFNLLVLKIFVVLNKRTNSYKNIKTVVTLHYKYKFYIILVLLNFLKQKLNFFRPQVECLNFLIMVNFHTNLNGV